MPLFDAPRIYIRAFEQEGYVHLKDEGKWCVCEAWKFLLLSKREYPWFTTEVAQIFLLIQRVVNQR